MSVKILPLFTFGHTPEWDTDHLRRATVIFGVNYMAEELRMQGAALLGKD
jgi:hypothetical protein